MTHQRTLEAPHPQADGGSSAFGAPGIWPIPSPSAPRHGASHGSPPPGYTESYGRATYLAFRFGALLVIQAEGTLPNLNQIADIRQSPLKIYPPQFDFLVYTPQTSLPVITPFKFSEVFGFPSGPPVVVIHDADGHHAVKIEEIPAKGAQTFLSDALETSLVKTGYGKSFEAAFSAAVALLPSDGSGTVDGLAQYRLVESGLIQGGIAGIHLYYARVEASFS
ncbi:hypothetical protein PMI01_02305 [Caulobacter sp. AP07]|uniref:hypothetical protein n=1 Tax=Caulobacter sp. AP07 TaxID=1144304 RepID=UPI000271DEC2|nr:hypothetical protein [Caulobacter sp. AP07]EJL33145.1 hypothetical protein PMI01_02305 [Caulobacter sp. AP07]